MRVALYAFIAFLAAGAAFAAEPVTLEQAREIALAQAGGEGLVVETDIDNRRGGGVVYEFEIHTGTTEFEIDIDGETGGVLEFSREENRRARSITPAPLARGRSGASPARMTAGEAQALALETAGGGEVSRYHLDRDDGRYVHEITVLRDGKRYRLEIDDADGTVGELSIRENRGRR